MILIKRLTVNQWRARSLLLASKVRLNANGNEVAAYDGARTDSEESVADQEGNVK